MDTRRLSAPPLFLACISACGGAERFDLLAPVDDGGSDASVIGDATSASDGATPQRPANDAGVTADGGINPPEAGPGGDTTRINCGAASCILPAETCCVSQAGGGGSAYACVVGATCPRAGNGGDTAALKCSGAANCAPGTVCCVRRANDNAASECKTACASNEAQLCDKTAADPGCGDAGACSSQNIGEWRLQQAYATCGGKGN